MMLKRFISPPEGISYFLFGPRGTGKTTWLKAHYPEAYWVDLVNPEIFRLFSASPEKLIAQPAASPGTKIVVIDEVQQVPALLDVAHRMIEGKRGYQFILTGSSARKLKRDRVNLLGGRALLKHMPPFLRGSSVLHLA